MKYQGGNPSYGTFSSASQVGDFLTVAAFHLGLKMELQQLKTLLENDHVIYQYGYTASELRKMFNQKTWPVFVEKQELYSLAEKIIRIAETGLKKEVIMKKFIYSHFIRE